MERKILDLDACIKGRRSVRAFTQEPVAQSDVEAILEAGAWAPTGMGREPWRFIVIEDRKVIKLVSDETKMFVRQTIPRIAKEFSTEADVICFDAPLLILVCAEKTRESMLQSLNLIDCVLAAQNMFLKAFELGLGTCYMGYVGFLAAKPEFLKKIGVPENYDVLVPFVLGHPKAKQGIGRRKKPIIKEWIK